MFLNAKIKGESTEYRSDTENMKGDTQEGGRLENSKYTDWSKKKM